MGETREYDRILLGTDGSPAAEAAIPHAVTIATQHNAEVDAVYVIDHRITMAADDAMRGDLDAKLESDGHTALDRIEATAAESGVAVNKQIRRGTPSKELLEYANEAEIDLIVIGSAGKSPREKLIGMGSVSERVVDKATIPVLVVPNHETA